MKFKVNNYYVLFLDEMKSSSTFGLYKCTAVKDDGVVFETFYAAGGLKSGFSFVKFESNDFWPNHMRNLYEMGQVINYNIFKNVISTLFDGEY